MVIEFMVRINELFYCTQRVNEDKVNCVKEGALIVF